MRTKAFLWVLLGCALLALAPIASGQQPEPLTVDIESVDTSAFPQMDVYVSVYDASHVPIAGLEAKDFQVLEDGGAAPISAVEPLKDIEVAMALALDISGSTAGAPLDAAKLASKAFLDRLGPNDPVAVIAFGPQVDLGEPFPRINEIRESDFTLNKEKLHVLLAGLTTQPNVTTPLYDGLLKAVKMTARQPVARRAVLILTDGRETPGTSSMQPDDPIAEANKQKVAIFTVGLGDNIDRDYLRRVALRTGGTYQEAAGPDPNQLITMFQNVVDQFKVRYRIRYTSQVPADGKGHNLMVKATARGITNQSQAGFTSVLRAPEFTIEVPAEIKGKVALSPQITFAQGGVKEVRYVVDEGALLQHTATASPFSWELDPRLLLPGGHTLKVVLVDAAGNTASAEKSFDYVVPTGANTWVYALIAAVAVILVGAVAFALTRQRRVEQVCPTCGRVMPPEWGGVCQFCAREQVYTPPMYAARPPAAGPSELSTQAGIFPTPTGAPGEPVPYVEPAVAPGREAIEKTRVLKAKPRALAYMVVAEGERRGKTYQLGEGDTGIGREADNDVVLSDDAVSRHHAKVRFQNGQFVIHDLAATNPTRVNGVEVTRQTLSDGDRIEIGKTVLVFKQTS